MTSKIISQPSCADAGDPNALRIEQAVTAIREALSCVREVESVPIRDALHRVLGVDCTSSMDVPSHTNSAVDGFAVRSEDLPTAGDVAFRVMGTALAGQSTDHVCGAGECIRIMTGAPMPPGTDSVVMQEHVERLDNQRVLIGSRHRRGQNVRYAGEDIARGTTVFSAGRWLSAADIGVLASLGFAELQVRRRVKVAFFSTGDELRSIGDTLEEGQIYDSNRYTLFSLLRENGADIIDLGVVRDDSEALREAFLRASRMADVVITSGGVSVGEADFTKSVLNEVGSMAFWVIAMKPGRPLTFGKIGDAVFFGLPGNPVAVMLTFEQFVKPALRYLSTGQWPIPLVVKAVSGKALKKRAGRFEFVRGIMSYDASGQLCVVPSGAQGSGILTSMSRANCFILLDEACDGVVEGDSVSVQPFSTIVA